MCAATALTLIMTMPVAPPAPLPPGDFESTVTVVIGADAVRVSVGDGDALVGLYGVSVLKRSREDIAAARDFVRERTAGSVVTVRPVTVVGGLPYVEISLPSGEVLNHTMIARGIADLDRLTAAGDGDYAALVTQNPAADDGPVEYSGTDAGESTAAPRITLEEFRMRRHLRETAQFEAGVEKWGMMAPEYRASVRRHYEESLAASSSNSADLLAALRSEVDNRHRALDSVRAGISDRQAAIEAERDRLSNDFDLRWNTRQYHNHLSDYYANRATGNDRSARTSGRLAERYRVRAHLDEARVGAEFEQIRQEHDASIRALTAEQRAQAEAIRNANSRLLIASINASDRIGRLLRTLVQFDLYDRAIAADILPSQHLRLLTVIDGTDAWQSAPIAIDAPLGRVDWYANPQRPDAAVTGTIYAADDRRPVARFRSNAPPHESFLLLDGPGSYIIETEVHGPVTYIIDVFAIDGN